MNLDYINSFILSFYDFLKNQIDLESRKGRLEIKNMRSPMRGVAILIGISGELNGTILIDMGVETAHRLSSKMNGEPSAEITDLFIATIKEFGNLVCGGAVVRLDQLKRSFDLSPPTVILGEQMMLATESKSEILVIPFLSDLGQIDLNIFSARQKVNGRQTRTQHAHHFLPKDELETYQAFAVESCEALNDVEVRILRLAEDPCEIAPIFRALHTVKGNSGL